MNNNKKNVYICQKCKGKIITIDKDKGVTPFMIECKVNKNCDGTMYSSFYQVIQLLKPEFEWFKPKSYDGYSEFMIKHFENGGLDIRRIK